MGSRPRKRKCPYPYPILPLPFNDSSPNPHPWCVHTVFHIEAILRSEQAHKAHREGDSHFQEFLKEHGIKCDTLKGEHHVLFTPYPGRGNDALEQTFLDHGILPGGITDLTKVVHLRPSELWGESGEKEILRSLRNPRSQFVYLKLDLDQSPSALVKALRPYLTQKREEWLASKPLDAIDEWYRETLDPVFGDVRVWVRYFQCYDLLVHHSIWSYGQIANKVYGTSEKRDTAELAIREIERIIAAAEMKNWPPRKPSR
ncbi:MAG: hypothetical protein H8K03_14390 [Nitrospira sp.]